MVYLHDGVLLGVPFDPVKLELRGTPESLVDGIVGDSRNWAGRFDVSRTATMVYLPGKPVKSSSSLSWMDSSGKTEPLLAKPGSYGSVRISPDGNWLALSMSMDSGKGSDIYLYDWRHDTMPRLTFNGNENNDPVWAPDGKHIAYSAADGLWWVRIDGSGHPQRLLESKGARIIDFSRRKATDLFRAEGCDEE